MKKLTKFRKGIQILIPVEQLTSSYIRLYSTPMQKQAVPNTNKRVAKIR